jgi:NADH:ubiquinone reductase (H+-translocating)
MSRIFGWQVTRGWLAGLLAGAVYAGLVFWLPALAGTGAFGPVPDSPGGLLVHLAVSGVLGNTYGLLFDPLPASRAESLVSGLAYGLLWWVVFSLNLFPIALGRGPEWQVEAAATALPYFFGYLFQGGFVGIGYHVLSELGASQAPAISPQRPPVQHRIVIVGGGCAGVATAEHLERLFERDESVAITLISNTNHLLFTPMLSEVTAGSVEPQHISSPLRAFFRWVQVIRGEVTTVDFSQRLLRLASGEEREHRSVPYDHLVVAVGSVPNFFGLPGVEGQALSFKSLEDATLLRNHVIEMLERADAEPLSERRKALLTFVVAGGGFAGAELVGAVNDFVRGSLWFYPRIPPEDVSVILVHSRETIMPELSAELGQYAQEKLRARGVVFKLGTRVAEVLPKVVRLNDGEMIPTETLVWTAGNMAHPLIRGLALEVERDGAVKTDATLRAVGHLQVWSVGDCAAVVDRRTGERCPPTAQHALRQAATLAHNIHAAIRNSTLESFSYRSVGSFAVLGYHTACAEIYGLKFSGLFAWLLWRTVYLLKLPTLEKKLRVALDWTVDLFFPRDIVQTMSFPGIAREVKPSSPASQRHLDGKKRERPEEVGDGG